MTENIIIIGGAANPIATFSSADHKILDLTYTSGVDVIGSELSIDEMLPTVRYKIGGNGAQIIGGLDFDGIGSTDFYVLASNRQETDLRDVPYGTVVEYWRGAALVIKAYVKSIERVSREAYRINAMSAIGLLDAQKHYGGMYTGETFGEVVDEIIGGVVPYTIDEAVASVSVFEWLPIGTKRANLHQLLFAFGVMVGRNSNGDMHFKYINNADTVVVPERRVYDAGSIEYPDPASEVQVTEHSYTAFQTDESVMEFDNSDGEEADHVVVEFQNAPLHDLTVTGTLTIDDSGVNYAIVSGTGTLSGKKYTHTTKVLTETDENATKQRIVTVDNCTLVSVVNSAAVLQRLKAYYSSRKIVTSSFVVDGEKAGDMLTLTDPYGDTVTGFVASMQARVSGKLKAEARLVTDFTPSGGGSYTTIVEYDEDQTIDLAALLAEYPDKDNDIVKLVLIGGGNGGKRGSNDGGAGGQGGLGGKVFSITVHVNDLEEAEFALHIGAGGASGEDGEATTFGDYSSENGNRPYGGVPNIFTGTVYALSGANGVKGASAEGSATYKGQTWQGGTHTSYTYTTPYFMHGGRYWKDGEIKGSNGYGGGAAVGNRGYNAAGYSDTSRLGYGGDGGNAINGTDATVRGCGGNGGHGGGAGGRGGRYTDSYTITDKLTGDVEYYTETGYAESGSSGTGGAGGRGGDGLLMIFI